MIEILFSTAILLYGALILFGFIFLYFFGELRARHVYRVLEHQFLWRCSFCNFMYLDEQASTLSLCPRCGSYNTVTDAQDRAVSRSLSQQIKEEAQESAREKEEQIPTRRNPARRKRPGQRRRGPRSRR
ncbi:MAG: hypothetical protein GX117_07845 [Candidatus Hydrogenedentes bacterium]|jgi:phage FluMu protein Com|nr:hypothetical protein [Candidatus Hydrogenedentota bacterium]